MSSDVNQTGPQSVGIPFLANFLKWTREIRVEVVEVRLLPKKS